MSHEPILREIADVLTRMELMSEVSATAWDANKVTEGKPGSRAPHGERTTYDDAVSDLRKALARFKRVYEIAAHAQVGELTNIQRDYWIGQTGGRPEDVAEQFGVKRQTVVHIRETLGLAVKTGKPLKKKV